MNHLKKETSPYLLQHADNPVDWHPWGAEALELAKKTNKPILLSVGYYACHWCHVMAHESFEDETTAKIMNADFINIKVDREERPDIDAIYMQAVTALTGYGGWPMTVFLTPEGKPFYGGTYFPKERKDTMPSFTEILDSITKEWKENPEELLQRAEQIFEALKQSQNPQDAAIAPQSSNQNLKRDLRLFAVRSLQLASDSAWGGFGRAPKFPQTMVLEFLIMHLSVSGSEHNQSYEVQSAHNESDKPSYKIDNDDISSLVKTQLDAMASGGIYDQLGGGFARYSTDIFWLVPHFEKMLYDNALLMKLYLHAYQLTHKPRYLQILKECRDYIMRDLYDLQSGGFYSAEDADSNNEDGKSGEGFFYTWSYQEFIDGLKGLDEGDIEPAKNWYGVTESGNFEGKNILYRRLRGDLSRPDVIEAARQTLFELRENRMRPNRDIKILNEWNAMTIQALAEANFVLNEDTSVAEKAGEFLYSNMSQSNGIKNRWLRSYTSDSDGNSGVAKHLANAADYAQMTQAFISLYSTTGNGVWLNRATEVADAMLDLFWDKDSDGLFSTGEDSQDVIFRPKDISDNSLPSANSAAAIALLKLGALTGSDNYQEKASKILDLCSSFAYQHPLGFGNILCALTIQEVGIIQIVIPGNKEADEVKPFIDELRKYFLPNAVIAFGEPIDSPIWEGKEAGKAYICRNFTCLNPADSVELFSKQLKTLYS